MDDLPAVMTFEARRSLSPVGSEVLAVVELTDEDLETLGTFAAVQIACTALSDSTLDVLGEGDEDG